MAKDKNRQGFVDIPAQSNEKPKLTELEKERRAKLILENAGKPIELIQDDDENVSLKPVLARVPEPYYKDIKKIMKLTGMSMNAVLLQILLPGIKAMVRQVGGGDNES